MKNAKTTTMKTVRRADASLVALVSSDSTASIEQSLKELDGKNDNALNRESSPAIRWDIMRGQCGLNQLGVNAARTMNAEPIRDPSEFLAAAAELPNNAIVFMLNAHRYWNNEMTMQAIWNLRDTFKGNQTNRTLVMLCAEAKLPSELRQDVIIIEEEHPDSLQIGTIVDSVLEPLDIKLNKGEREKTIDTLLGYENDYAVEQALALALPDKAKEKPSIKTLWERRVSALKSQAGLEIVQPMETFEDLIGVDGVKWTFNRYLNGKRQPRVVFLLDEIEKMLAGSQGGDLSGVTSKMLEQWLYWTESEKVDAALLLGIPGAGKTQTARCIAGQARIPMCRGSMSMVQGELVGQSEQQMAKMLKTVSALGQGNILMLATCNNFDNLPPEVVARFKLAKFMYPYPTKPQSESLWAYYMKKYELKGKHPQVDNWVGREIEQACYSAWLFDSSLQDCIDDVVPISVANASKMNALMQSASGRFRDANRKGVYTCNSQAAVGSTGKSRRAIIDN